MSDLIKPSDLQKVAAEKENGPRARDRRSRAAPMNGTSFSRPSWTGSFIRM
jgi:hypothetical protein